MLVSIATSGRDVAGRFIAMGTSRSTSGRSRFDSLRYPALRKKSGTGILPVTNSHHRQDADATEKKAPPRSGNT